MFFSGAPTPRTPREQAAVSYNVYSHSGAPAIHTNDEIIYSAFSFTGVDGSTRLVIHIESFETPRDAQLFLHELMGEYHDMPVAGAAVH